jgi:hypothetical protein
MSKDGKSGKKTESFLKKAAHIFDADEPRETAQPLHVEEVQREESEPANESPDAGQNQHKKFDKFKKGN